MNNKPNSIYNRIVNHINNKEGFLKSVSILVGGTAFAQLVGILILPIVTRIYSPEDFSKFAVFSSVIAIISTIACLRFEIAIPMPKTEKQALHLLLLSLLSTIIFVILSSLFLIIWGAQFDILTKNRISEYKIYIPLAVLLLSISTILQLWAIRDKKYKVLARTRIIQSVNGALAQIIFGFMKIGTIGLIISYLIQSISGLISLLNSFKESINKKYNPFNVHDLRDTFIEYKNYPIFSTAEALLNVLSSQLPILLIGIYLDVEAAYFMLGIKLLSAPINLIGKATGQVFLGQAAEEFRRGNLKNFTIKISKNLAIFALLPFILVLITAPIVVPFVFGSEWARAGYLISIMTPWFFLQFITNPVSMALHVCNEQKVAMYLQFVGLVLRVCPLALTLIVFKMYAAETFILSSAVFYLIYFIVVIHTISTKETSSDYSK